MPEHRFNQRTSHSKPSATRTGGRYDGRHKQARAQAATTHHHTNPCARCGQPLGPMSHRLHYDHDEHGGYLGFSHASCNLRAGAIKGNHLQPRPTQHTTTPTPASYPIAQNGHRGYIPPTTPDQDPPATFFFDGQRGDLAV